MRQCERCRKSHDGPGAYCPACHKTIRESAGDITPTSNERPPADPIKGPVLPDLDYVRVYDYDPKYRSRRRGHEPIRHEKE